MNLKNYSQGKRAICFAFAAFIGCHAGGVLASVPAKTVAKAVAYADTEVSGKVLSDKNEPLVGVNVILKGTSIGTTTDPDGRFQLMVPDGGTLTFSFIGYLSQEISVGNRSEINVQLMPDTKILSEVVVTAYATQKKKDITGSVSVVDVKNITKQPNGLVSGLLQGQASGVTVISSGQPGAEPQVRIRGINTFGNNTPLYVVDGVPTQNSTNLNPNDIASIQVLKDAGAASIYGSRASNGVIIITTKKGTGKVSVQYDAYYGVQVPKSGNVWDLLSPTEEAKLRWIANKNSNLPINDPIYGSGPEPVIPDYIYPLGKMEGDSAVDPSKYYINPNYKGDDDYNKFYRIIRANKAGTDWYHEVFKPAVNTSHNLSVSGGTDKGNYMISLNYLNQQGTMLSTYLKRYNLRANTLFNVSKRIRIGENLTYTITSNPQQTELSDLNIVQTASQMAPIFPVRDIMGNYAGIFGTGYNGNNPVGTLERLKDNRTLGNRLFGNMFAEVDVLKDLTFRTNFGGEMYSGTSRSFVYPTYENNENTKYNAFTQGSSNGYAWTWTNTLTYKKLIGSQHDITVVLGNEAYKSYFENLGGTTRDYYTFDRNYTTLSTGSGIQSNYSGRSFESLNSQFGRLDYAFKGKYLLSGTLRRDGSSKFVRYQYGWFPSVSAGWRLSEEGFMQGIKWLADLKVRGSWGVMGNQLNVNANNGYYTFIMDKAASYYDIGRTNNSNQPGFQVGQIGNPDAKWERNINANIGIDATFLSGMIDVSIDYFRKDIKDLLYNPAVVGTQGPGTVPFVNIAGTTNRGIDLSANFHKNLAPDLRLDLGATFTSYKNKVTRVTDNTNYFFSTGRALNGINYVRNEVGHPIGSFYGYQITGFWNTTQELDAANEQARQVTGNAAAVYQTDQALGRFRFKDANGDGIITADDRTFLGNPNPDFNYGLNVGLTYKRFDISAFFYGVQGADIWNQLRYSTDFYASFVQAKSKRALYDSWTPENKNATLPIQETKMTAATNGSPTSYYVEDGSYLRLKNIQLGYNLPASLLSKINVSNLRIYVQAANVFTMTKYIGLDPEIGGSATSFGVDKGLYPNDRQFLGGIQVSF
ncbi:SusC/RagA family TonB-linked outer membrane protein [Dyadobacter beijingensis]|uniref:SusC/RagA family TonB-linked outer membrane protein n=1 Tax=Dyadobacter beijingensis TaxID=365489 RepID=A0ABQ2HW22_9BACT|nr:TonB-dependent receptor [Dyadobacter beijingensis]GGM93354.1 SusC/RagA family TonB-linked outer membrane protein [Dyadobacter beijingensis]